METLIFNEVVALLTDKDEAFVCKRRELRQVVKLMWIIVIRGFNWNIRRVNNIITPHWMEYPLVALAKRSRPVPDILLILQKQKCIHN